VDAPERRRLHRRLAGVVEDPEERARHLALGADEPSDEVAEALFEAAHEAGARGAPAAAAELAELAVRLTPPDSEQLVERRLWAAGFHNAAGEWPEGAAILERLVEELPRGDLRALALNMLSDTVTDDLARVRDLHEQALADIEHDEAQAALTECYLSQNLTLLGLPEGALEYARSALRTAERSGCEPRVVQALANLLYLETRLAVEPTPGLLDRVTAVADSAVWPGNDPPDRPRLVLAWRLLYAGSLDEARERVSRDADDMLGMRGDVARIPHLLTLAWLECRAGNWQLAARHAAEACDLSEEVDHANFISASLNAAAVVDAHLGRVEQVRDELARAMTLSETFGDGVVGRGSSSILAFLELSLGDSQAAAGILRPLVAELDAVGMREPAMTHALPNAVEALVALGELGEARRLLADLQDRVHRTGSPWGEATAGRCEGMVAAAEGDVDAALAAYDRALLVHEQLPQPFDLARTLLAKGVAQRRARQRRAARETLERALEILEGLGARLWADKARPELGRIGGRAASGRDLTPTERRVAELVVEGRSNKEVAAALVVSTKTVDGHLSNIYAKLGIHSRTQLARRLAHERAE
jgi:DNA-binding CsgD family transcriptional regulator